MVLHNGLLPLAHRLTAKRLFDGLEVGGAVFLFRQKVTAFGPLVPSVDEDSECVLGVGGRELGGKLAQAAEAFRGVAQDNVGVGIARLGKWHGTLCSQRGVTSLPIVT